MTALNFDNDRPVYDADLDPYQEDREDTREPTTWDLAGAPWGNQTIATWEGF